MLRSTVTEVRLRTGIQRRGTFGATLIRVLALLGVFALLSVTTIAASVSAQHSGVPAHNCHFCHFSNLPVAGAGGWIAFLAPEAMVGVALCETVTSEVYFVLACQPPRAPPA